MRQRGVIAAYSRKRNFLLIRPEGEERRLFCHRSEIPDLADPRPGTLVEFSICTKSANEARSVKLVG